VLPSAVAAVQEAGATDWAAGESECIWLGGFNQRLANDPSKKRRIAALADHSRRSRRTPAHRLDLGDDGAVGADGLRKLHVRSDVG